MSTVAPAQWLGKKPLSELSNAELCDELDRYESEFYRILGSGPKGERPPTRAGPQSASPLPPSRRTRE